MHTKKRLPPKKEKDKRNCNQKPPRKRSLKLKNKKPMIQMLRRKIMMKDLASFRSLQMNLNSK
jgi:hypothetical protein